MEYRSDFVASPVAHPRHGAQRLADLNLLPNPEVPGKSQPFLPGLQNGNTNQSWLAAGSDR